MGFGDPRFAWVFNKLNGYPGEQEGTIQYMAHTCSCHHFTCSGKCSVGDREAGVTLSLLNPQIEHCNQRGQ